jgi:hypothetical protein
MKLLNSGNRGLIGRRGLVNSYQIFGLLALPVGFAVTLFGVFTLRSGPVGGVGVSAMVLGLTALCLAPNAPQSGETCDRLLRQTLNGIILRLGATFGVLNIILATAQQADISVYFIADCLAFLVIALAHVGIGPRTRTDLNFVATVLFAAFLVVVVLKFINQFILVV